MTEMAEMKTYEGMFLVDAGNPDFEASTAPIRTVLDRSDAEVLSSKPWDERRLAYEISGRKRALYVLTYFKLDPSKMPELERDIELNEDLIRAMILRRDALSDDVLNAETPATSAPAVVEGEEGAEGAAPAAPAEGAAPAAAAVAAAAVEAPAAEAAPVAEAAPEAPAEAAADDEKKPEAPAAE
jgi:small subunit ribosomal protein S6